MSTLSWPGLLKYRIGRIWFSPSGSDIGKRQPIYYFADASASDAGAQLAEMTLKGRLWRRRQCHGRADPNQGETRQQNDRIA